MGVCCGILDTAHWTERSVCYLLTFLNALLILDDPSADIDPAEREDNWHMYGSWLPNEGYVALAQAAP